MRWLLVLIVGCSRSNTPVAPDPIDAVPAKVLPPAPIPNAAECNADGDCGYDDACFAKACVARAEAGPNECDKSMPPPGRCLCSDNKCTLVRNAPKSVALKTGCKSSAECELRPRDGTCVAGKGALFIEQRGAFCTCDAGTCVPDFVDPIACKTNTDCSLLEDPLRPAPSSKVPRPFPPITPCKTGERDSVCSKGHCVIRVWAC